MKAMVGKSYRKKACWLSAALLLLAGCGSQEGSQSSEPTDIEIFYHADDGEFRDIYREDSSESESEAEEEKIILTFSAAGGIMGSEGYYTRLVKDFNRENEKYHVELTEYDWNEMGDANTRTVAEVGSGGGPDLMTKDVFPVNQEIMDSGILVDLAPYLKESGITTEKYFPGYASLTSGDRIYGVCFRQTVVGCRVEEKVLGSQETPDLETLVDKLLEYPEKASFFGQEVQSRYILKYFLEGSEDLWGAINWEEGTCDFTVPIFSKILEVVKRYREDGKKGYDPIAYTYSVEIGFPESDAESHYPGTVWVGTYFDDGPHYYYQVNGESLMINANTEHLEGAYAFVSYAMSKSGQNFSMLSPVNREIWEAQYQHYLEEIEAGRSPLVLNDEIRDEVLEAYDDARFAPKRTEEILEIVYDAADGYIEGDQSKEDVIDQIQNRVQLYLDEQG